MLFGKFAHTEFPPTIQKAINITYSRAFDINFSEFDPPESYKSLSRLFIRELKKPRELEDGFISPSDGTVADFGEAKESFSIKGKEYSFAELSPFDFSPKSFINIYLSPKDYHRYHAPTDFEVLEKVEIDGPLLPVNSLFLGIFDDIFTKNKRTVLLCKTADGKRFLFVAVGALNVGKIIFNEKKSFKKGEELGYFDLGSSILIFFEKDFKFSIIKNNKVLFGKTI